jgi:hypothetical protein
MAGTHPAQRLARRRTVRPETGPKRGVWLRPGKVDAPELGVEFAAVDGSESGQAVLRRATIGVLSAICQGM